MLWTGLALGILPCEKSQPLLNGIETMVKSTQGIFLRIFPLPLEYDADQSSLDMEVGAIFGLAMNYHRCPENRNRLRTIWKNHMTFLAKNGFKVAQKGPESKIRISPSLKYLTDVITSQMGVDRSLFKDSAKSDFFKNPGQGIRNFIQSTDLLSRKFGFQFWNSYSVFETGLLLNINTITAKKMPCYPVHLSTIQLILLSWIQNGIPYHTHNLFCQRTKGIGLPLTDWFCHRMNEDDVNEYLKSDESLNYEYRHQRCHWESADAESYETHQLDWLIIYLLSGNTIR